MVVSGHSTAEQVSFWNAEVCSFKWIFSSSYCQSGLVSTKLRNEGTLGDK